MTPVDTLYEKTKIHLNKLTSNLKEKNQSEKNKERLAIY